MNKILTVHILSNSLAHGKLLVTQYFAIAADKLNQGYEKQESNMDTKVTVITLYEEDMPKIAGILNNDLVNYICHQAGINTCELDTHLAELAEKGLVTLSEATLH